jgi:hypothetical protein
VRVGPGLPHVAKDDGDRAWLWRPHPLSNC